MDLPTAILSSISIVNMIVLSILIIIFTRSYIFTKAELPQTFILFSGLLFLHNLIAADAYFSITQLFSTEVFPYLIGIHGTELIGLLLFLKISWK